MFSVEKKMNFFFNFREICPMNFLNIFLSYNRDGSFSFKYLDKGT